VVLGSGDFGLSTLLCFFEIYTVTLRTSAKSQQDKTHQQASQGWHNELLQIGLDAGKGGLHPFNPTPFGAKNSGRPNASRSLR
jgi:hypothetical protein